jgi:hypothetical protein
MKEFSLLLGQHILTKEPSNDSALSFSIVRIKNCSFSEEFDKMFLDKKKSREALMNSVLFLQVFKYIHII